MARFPFLGFILLLILVMSMPNAANGFDYSTTARWIGAAERLGIPDEAVAVNGNLAVAGGPGSDGWSDVLMVYDITDPAAPITLSNVALDGGPKALQIRGMFVYSAGGNTFECCSYDMFDVIDIQNPLAPVVVGTYMTFNRGYFRDVELVGNFAYLLDASRLSAIDITNPAQPSLAGMASFPTGARKFCVRGAYIYVADGAAGLLTFDITNPASPTLVHTLATPDSAYDAVVDEDNLYIAVGQSGAVVADLADPAAPQLVASIDTPGSAQELELAADVLCVWTDVRSLQYISYWSTNIEFIDVSNPLAPSLKGNIGLAGWPGGLTSANGLLYAAATNDGLQIYDPSTVNSPETFSQPASMALGLDLRVAGSWAFVAVDDSASNDALRVFDVSDPTQPIAFGALPLSYVREIDVQGGYAYLGADITGFHVVDISNPAAPLLVGSLGSVSDPYDVAVSGNVALYAQQQSVRVIDVSNPANPLVLSTVPANPGYVRGVAISGSTGYLTRSGSGNSRLVSFDLTNPATPVVLSSTLLSGDAFGLTLDGDYCYYSGGWDGGLRIFDVSNPSSPLLVGETSTPPNLAGDPVIRDGIAYIPAEAKGVVVVDVSDPSAPTVIGEVNTVGKAQELAIAGDYLLAADLKHLLATVPLHAAAVSTPLPSGNARIAPEVVVWPNPTRAASTIRWSLPAVGEDVRVSVWDLSGRRVRSVSMRDVSRDASIAWDGNDDEGRPLASGVYLIRLVSDRFHADGRVTIIR